jgi:MFS family permease
MIDATDTEVQPRRQLDGVRGRVSRVRAGAQRRLAHRGPCRAGAGAAFVMPLALAQIAAAFPSEARPKALGVFATLTGVAVPLGPPVGGAVVEGSRGHGSSG